MPTRPTHTWRACLADARRRHPQRTRRFVAIYTRGLGFGDALVAPELAAGHLGNPLLQTILVRTSNPATVAPRLRNSPRATRGCASVTERR